MEKCVRTVLFVACGALHSDRDETQSVLFASMSPRCYTTVIAWAAAVASEGASQAQDFSAYASCHSADVVRAGVASLSLGELESLQKELKNCNQLTRETLLQCLSILPSGCMNRCIGNGCLGRCVEVGVPGCCIPG